MANGLPDVDLAWADTLAEEVRVQLGVRPSIGVKALKQKILDRHPGWSYLDCRMLREVLNEVKALEAVSCRATEMELQLRHEQQAREKADACLVQAQDNLRKEQAALASLRAEKDTRDALERSRAMECTVCSESADKDQFAFCSNDTHALCVVCFESYAKEELARSEAVVRDRKALLLCPNRASQVGGCDGFFCEKTCAKLLSTGLHTEHMDQVRSQIRYEEHRKANGVLNKIAEQVRQQIPGLCQSVLETQLRQAVPGAKQCHECGFGPIEHYACESLTAHHGEISGAGKAKINNACPECGWFANNIRDWPAWNGKVHTNACQGGAFLDASGGADNPCGQYESDEQVAARLAQEEEQRLAQIRADHALAQRLERERA
jgi:hypothetical protein